MFHSDYLKEKRKTALKTNFKNSEFNFNFLTLVTMQI